MRIIHCADLHLDSPMDSRLTRQQAETRGNELRLAFTRLVRYAAENQVRVVMICGDLFDSNRVTYTTAELVLDAIRSAPQIDFLYLRGNHDEAVRVFKRAGLTMPENLKLFSQEWNRYTYENVTITGVELCQENDYAPYDSLQLDERQINIVMLHGQVGASAGQDLVDISRLRGKGIDYLALGHIHSCSGDRLDARGVWCYSGCLEGRGFDECGEKGFVLLETTPTGGLNPTFVPFASRILAEASVDVTGMEGFAALRTAAERATANLPEGSMVSLILTGESTLNLQKNPELLAQTLNQRFWHTRIRDESRLAISPEEYAHDISLKGAFVRRVMAEESDSKLQEQILRCGLQALRGEGIDL